MCPQHRHKNLESLIKKEKGNKDKIGEQITLWWDEPVPAVEEKWEDVSKKSKPAANQNQSQNHPKDKRDFHNRDNHRDNSNNNNNSSNANHNNGGNGSNYSNRNNNDNHNTNNNNNNNNTRERRGDRDGHVGGRGYGRTGDRGGRGAGRGAAGGRGGGPDGRRTRGNREDGTKANRSDALSAPAAVSVSAEQPKPLEKQVVVELPVRAAVPAPVVAHTSQQPPTWASLAAAAAKAPAAPQPVAVAVAVAQELVSEDFPVPIVVLEEKSLPLSVPRKVAAALEGEDDYDVGIMSAQDPTPSGRVDSVSAPAPKTASSSSAPANGNVNVWATKGSAYLIQKEKFPVALEDASTLEQTSVADIDIAASLLSAPEDAHDLMVPVEAVDLLQSGWADASAVGPVSIDGPLMDHPASVAIIEEQPVAPVALEQPVPVPIVVPVEMKIKMKQPTMSLNMAHWDTGEGEDSVNHDFQFGGFDDHVSVDESAPVQESVSVATASPARPPPGLSMVGMPPMPEKIVSVSELENKLDGSALNNTKEAEPTKAEQTALPDNLNSAPQNMAPVATGGPPEGFAQQPGLPQQNYAAAGQYGMGMGMYNYNAQTAGVGAPNGFMGANVPGVGAPLGVPPQQKQQNLGQQQPAGGLPQQQQHGSIYGAPAAAPSIDNNAPANNDANNNHANAAMPPGMAGMAHYNPAFMYGQQPYQMPAQAYGVAPGYGFAGQYGGVQGFGYQQVMGQGAGYGQPQPYEDQGQHHGGNNHQGGYNNKNSGGNGGGGGGGGGYRGRNNHQNQQQQQQQQQQYQNQYNQQGHAAYGGQPYNMGYNDHFNQRGGYGQQPMDPYMQNSGYHQENEHGKGNKSKGNNRNNYGNNNQNTQQHQQGAQFGGLQQGGAGAGASDNSNPNPTFQGWSGGGL